MPPWQAIEVILGVVLVALALRDVFDTVVVPGATRGALRVARRLLSAMLPLWKRMRRCETGISTSFAPAVLMASFVPLMALLLIGFGLIAHGLGSWFAPSADDFEQAAFMAGSALATFGLSGNGSGQCDGNDAGHRPAGRQCVAVPSPFINEAFILSPSRRLSATAEAVRLSISRRSAGLEVAKNGLAKCPSHQHSPVRFHSPNFIRINRYSAVYPQGF